MEAFLFLFLWAGEEKEGRRPQKMHVKLSQASQFQRSLNTLNSKCWIRTLNTFLDMTLFEISEKQHEKPLLARGLNLEALLFLLQLCMLKKIPLRKKIVKTHPGLET